MVTLDSAPVTVRGPLVTTGSGLVTFARIFVHDGRLFIAEGTQRGAKVSSVHEYPLPDGEPERDPRKSRAGSWGDFRWSNCGCGNSWGRHSVASLVAQAILLEADPLEDAGPDDPGMESPGSPDADSSGSSVADIEVDETSLDSANAQVSTGVQVDTLADVG